MSSPTKTYRIASYNVENMSKIFSNSNTFSEKYSDKRKAISSTLHNMRADILGIIEGENKIENLEYFIANTQLSNMNYKVAKSSENRGKQDLVFFYRNPFEIVTIDENIVFYEDWYEDIDSDGIKEELKFERKPLEILFRNKDTNKELLIILVSFKSKGVFTSVDFYKYEHLALANRKKLYAQSKKVRQRINEILNSRPELPFIVMGDINDEIGLDHFQKMLGASAVETIMGDIFHPDKLMHNALWHLIEEKGIDNIWTVEYPEPIVDNDKSHKSLIDHIFVSPSMLNSNSPIRLVENSGSVFDEKVAMEASDHLPIYCEITCR